MTVESAARNSDSPFVKSIARTICHASGSFRVVPDGSWDILVIKHHDFSRVLVTGALTRPIFSVNEVGDELLCISFKPGVYSPYLLPQVLRDRSVRTGSSNGRSFGIFNESFEIPDFENADDFVNRLYRCEFLTVDELVSSRCTGDPIAASLRSIQRHFLKSTGLTLNFYQQLERAKKAEKLLRQGCAAADAAYEAGFTDQSHMINSLKAILGQTPTEITGKNQSAG